MTEQQRGSAASGIQREIALRVAAVMKAQEAKFKTMEARLAEAVKRAESLVQELEGMKAKQAALIAEMDGISKLGGGGIEDIDFDVEAIAASVDLPEPGEDQAEEEFVAPSLVDDAVVEALRASVEGVSARTERLEQQQKTTTIAMNALRNEVDILKSQPAYDVGGAEGVSPFVERDEVGDIVKQILAQEGVNNGSTRVVPPASGHDF